MEDENQEKENQEIDEWQISNYKYQLPIVGSDNSDLLRLGIELGPFIDGDTYRGANLPYGWRTEKTTDCLLLVDDKNRLRVKLFDNYLVFCNRFSIGLEPANPDIDNFMRFCVWDHTSAYPAKPLIVFEKTSGLPSRAQHRMVHDERMKIYTMSFEKDARRWLDANYPNWNDFRCYWD